VIEGCVQVISEGWASPLRGFMREGVLLQTLHFNSLVVDPWNSTGAINVPTRQTDWNDYTTRGRERVSMAVPIVLPITKFTKDSIEVCTVSFLSRPFLTDSRGRTRTRRPSH
jgi:3'-phosphoadenosine 5'-phosphosulfate synthase